VTIGQQRFGFLALCGAVDLEASGLEESLHPNEDAVLVIDHQ